MFLPASLRRWFAAALLAVAACAPAGGDAVGRDPADAGATQAKVVAGTGDVDPSALTRVRGLVDEELPKLRAVFGGEPRGAFFVHVHAARETLPDSLAALLPVESPAFALLGQHQIHLVIGEIIRLGVDPAAVVRHELVHELLDQYVAPNGRSLPRWFHEGLAQHLAGDTYLGAREEDLAWRILARSLRGFGELRERFPSDVEPLRLAYAQSYSYVSWLVREFGLRDLLDAARATNAEVPFDSALAGRLGRRTVDLDAAWRDYVIHGSGAPWRVAFDQCFTFLMVLALPVLVLALRRHLAREGRTARLMVDKENRAAAAAAAAAQAAAEAAVMRSATIEAAEAPATDRGGAPPAPPPDPMR